MFCGSGRSSKEKDNFNLSSSDFNALFKRELVLKPNNVVLGFPVLSATRADDLSASGTLRFRHLGSLCCFSRWTCGLWWLHVGLFETDLPAKLVEGLTQLALFDKDELLYETKLR